MRVVYTNEALRDLDEILTFIGANYPVIMPAFIRRLQMIERRGTRASERTSPRSA